ncbi:MAG: hypothetical protein KDB53_00390 [Planctomycetes bacterium]|nr:hypothetical protein [Planctomycetota bacterium]
MTKTATKRPRRTRAPKKPTPAATGALAGLCDAYITALPGLGKSPGTARSYAADLKVAIRHFGADVDAATITVEMVAAYFASDSVTKTRAGDDKNPITVAKLQRVFRLALLWAEEQRIITVAPIPPKS